MPAWVIDVALVLMMMGIVWAVSSEGLWGAALMFVNIMFAGLVAFNFYEPAARMLDTGPIAPFADFISLVVLFCVAFSLLRFATDNIAPTMVRFPGWLYQGGRFLFAVATGWYLVGMVLCMLETAPIHKQFLGYQWQRHAFWGLGVDRFWLGFVQATTDRYLEQDPARPFDARSDFILRYHNHRPFGDPDPALAVGKPAAPAAASGEAAAEQAAGTTGPSRGGPPPVGTPMTPGAGAAGVAPTGF